MSNFRVAMVERAGEVLLSAFDEGLRKEASARNIEVTDEQVEEIFKEAMLKLAEEDGRVVGSTLSGAGAGGLLGIIAAMALRHKFPAHKQVSHYPELVGGVGGTLLGGLAGLGKGLG